MELEGGICVNCPTNCLKCQKDNFFRMHSECTQCKQGFDLFDGQCVRSCNKNTGNSLIYSNLTNTTSCVKCADSNCIDCSSNANVCKKCSIFYSLNNGTCLLSCPSNTTQVPA